MKNRVKNLFIAGLMLMSMGFATVVQAAPAWAATKSIIGGGTKEQAENNCYSSGGHPTNARQGGSGYWLVDCVKDTSSSSGSTTTSGALINRIVVSGNSKEAAENDCISRGGYPTNPQQVNNGGWIVDCIPNPSAQSGDSGGESGESGSSGGGENGTGTSATTIKNNGEYTYGAGLDHKDNFETSILDCESGQNGEGIFCILNIGLTVLTWGVGIAATIGIVLSGVQYLTARDSAEQVTKAKNRLINIVIGLVVYAVMWGFLTWLIPGGIF